MKNPLIPVLILLLFACGTQRRTIATATASPEPIGPYHIMEGGISYNIIHDQIHVPSQISKEKKCDHEYLIIGFEDTDTTLFDMMLLFERENIVFSRPCICIYCHQKSNCF